MCGRERGERRLARRARRARGESGARARSARGKPRLIWKEGGASPPLVPPCTAAGVRRPIVLLPFSDLFDFQRRPALPSLFFWGASGATGPAPRVERERRLARAVRSAMCGRARAESTAACPMSDVTSHGGVLRPGQRCCELLWLGVSRVHACQCVASLRGLVVVRGTIVVGVGAYTLSPCARAECSRARARAHVSCSRVRSSDHQSHVRCPSWREAVAFEIQCVSASRVNRKR